MTDRTWSPRLIAEGPPGQPPQRRAQDDDDMAGVWRQGRPNVVSGVERPGVLHCYTSSPENKGMITRQRRQRGCVIHAAASSLLVELHFFFFCIFAGGSG